MTLQQDYSAGQARDLTLAGLRRKRLVSLAVPVVLLAYFAYVFAAFDVMGLAQRAKMDNARILVADSYSYKVHITRDARGGQMDYAIEGETKGRYPQGQMPDWVSGGIDDTVIDLGGGHVIQFLPDRLVTYEKPGFGTVEVQFDGASVVAQFPGFAPGDSPDWANVSNARVSITTDAGRLTVTRSKDEVFRYFLGWELFWFTLDSPYHGVGLADLLFGPQIDPARSNLVGAYADFMSNQMWRHADVFWAVGETILMAFLGTFGAAIIALPLAFLAAKNFAPLMLVRQVVRRLFDFVRGVDGLIWTIILSRAFGPGPMTGAIAILITDTGGFGKSFSEALENVDTKQIEGVTSTGANSVQTYRFGVIPQVTPILLSQILYYFESNTRSATIIGAITGGGIGLFITQAIQTQKDWEEVTYYIVLIVIMVIAMDALSGWLRRKLIKGE